MKKVITILSPFFIFLSLGSADEAGLRVSGAVTHSDWIHMTKVDPDQFMDFDAFWGRSGVRYIIDRCKAAGMTRLYWRISDGGEVYHDTGIDRDKDGHKDWIVKEEYLKAYRQRPNPFGPGEDVLSYAVKYAHDQGLELYAWYTLDEENHYGSKPTSRFCVIHPEYRAVDRSGRIWEARLSFAFPEVRAYKLSLIRELVDRYKVDGLLLDFARRGLRQPKRGDAVRAANGVHILGYDSRSCREYVSEHGVDPRSEGFSNSTGTWIQFRADYWTKFLREIRSEFPQLPVVPMVFETDAKTALNGDLLDWDTWLNESLVDSMCFLLNNTSDGLMYGGDWNDLPRPLSKTNTVIARRRKEISGRAAVTVGVYCYRIASSEIESITDFAREAGADELLWWETQCLEWADYKGSRWKTVTALSK